MKLSALLSLFTLITLPTFAHAASDEACQKIENMLVSVQLSAPNLSDSGFNAMNESLKSAHTKYCESESSSLFSDASALTYADGSPIEAGGRFFMPDGREFQDVNFSSAEGLLEDAVSNSSARILKPFLAGHARCASGCRYVSWGIWGDARHQAKRSCHNSGEAIDIHAIVCGGKTYPSLSARFNQYASCMKGNFGVIYGKGDHRDHAHIELRHCQMCSGLNCTGSRK